MGTGDWNDGMNLVGAGGKGESVWLGWFLVSLLPSVRRSRRSARRRGARRRVSAIGRGARPLPSTRAWDGDWYRRAYFDDGTPLGSQENAECRIDAIAQSWSVISGAGDPDAGAAGDGVGRRSDLVRRDDALVLLLAPPFDTMTPSPGYIQGYLPGVRENGGQYTHAALWNVLAFAQTRRRRPSGRVVLAAQPGESLTDPTTSERYRVEPYVVAADVYSVAPHTGRGGWTWYTGSAGWMYRVGVEAMLGISTPWRCASHRSMHSEKLAGLRSDLQARWYELPHHRREPGWCLSGRAAR